MSNLRQFISSDISPQSLSASHCQWAGIQRPLEHRNLSGLHVLLANTVTHVPLGNACPLMQQISSSPREKNDLVLLLAQRHVLLFPCKFGSAGGFRRQSWWQGCRSHALFPPVGDIGNQITYEPRHEKTCFSHMRTTKVHISLHIPRSLISNFVVRILDSIISIFAKSQVSRL